LKVNFFFFKKGVATKYCGENCRMEYEEIARKDRRIYFEKQKSLDKKYNERKKLENSIYEHIVEKVVHNQRNSNIQEMVVEDNEYAAATRKEHEEEVKPTQHIPVINKEENKKDDTKNPEKDVDIDFSL